MKRKLYLLGMFAATAFLTACSQDEVQESKVTSYEVKEPANYTGTDFITVAEGDTMELLLQPDTGVVRWQNKETGEYVDNKKTVEEGFSESNTTALSDLIVTYYSGSENSKYNTTSVMDSQTFGINTDGLVYEKMDNGVRFVYTLGSDDITYRNFPTYIDNDRMEEFVLQHLDASQRRTLRSMYRQMNNGVWSRSSGKDTPLSSMAAPLLYSFFYEIGTYTEEELLADNTQHDKLEDMPTTFRIEVVMEYTLDGDDLVVNIPTEHLVTDEEYPIRDLQVMPYLMSSNAEEGYMFVPDGSGSLMYFDNVKVSEDAFSGRYYGGDLLQNTQTYVSGKAEMMLPVYGMKSGDFAVLGVIEDGAEVARLNSYIKNYFNGIDYARSSLAFYINDAQQLFKYVGSITNYTMVKNPTDYYADDITLRYSFLTGDEANYSGMAHRYQELLVEDGVLTDKTADTENAPLFLNLLGELDKEKYFLGIPYDSSIALTSFAQASEILKDLAAADIKDVIVKYDGIVNGGINQRAVEKVKISSRLGGSSEWKKLLETAEELGAQIFPSVELQTAYTKKDLSKKELAYTLSGSIANIYTFDPVDYLPEDDAKYMEYIIAPKYIEKYAEKFTKSYEKLGIENVASSDFMTFISPDYRNDDNISQTTAMPMYQNALNTLSEKYNVMLSNPRVDAYASVDYLTDIPVGNSEFKVLDVAVPFTQMVLDGYITYGADYVNKASEDISLSVMRAMETKSALNFRLIDTATTLLADTTMDSVFFSEYDTWKEDIIESYETYNEFYQLVKDAQIVEHDVINQNDDLRVVTYSNGVKIYFNYGDENVLYDGVRIPAQSYVVQ